MMEFSHKTVLLREAVEGLNIRPDGIYVDGTAGGGGHSAEIAARLKKGMLYSFDRDAEAIAAAGKRLAGLRAELIHAEFSRMKGELAARGVSAVDGILLDLGVSSHQLDDAERGFSYSQDAPLDMRMSSTGMTAAELLNTAPQAQIERILRVYGEEKFSSRIASKICARREENPLSTTGELAAIIRESIPAAARREGGNPCKRTFQAVRIAVNDELGELERVLEEGFSLLAPGGRFVIITFHSLEDRLVKQSFAERKKGCVCPPDFPVCVCGKTPQGKLVNTKPILPSEEELAENKRSKSAKLRILEKL